MKDSQKVRWVTLLAALVLLYDGIDSMFFDRVVGSDPLAWIDRTHAILLGTLLITFNIGLFVVAWTGQPITAMNTGSTIVGKLFSCAFCAAVGAFVFGLFLVRTTKLFDSRYVAGMVLSGAFLLCVRGEWGGGSPPARLQRSTPINSCGLAFSSACFRLVLVRP
jgi:hypothetical protein